MAVSFTQIWTKKLVEIPAGQTAIVDTRNFSAFQAATYIMTFYGGSKLKSFNLKVKKENADVIETVFGNLGNLNISVTPKVVGSSYLLEVTNNEAFLIGGQFVRAYL